MPTIRTLGRAAFDKVIPSSSSRRVREGIKRALTFAERARYYHGQALPTEVEIETNGICNLSCSYCPRPSNEQSTNLEDEVVESILTQLHDWGFMGQLSFHNYNEPLTDPRVFDFVKMARVLLPHNDLYIFTNGVLLTRQKASTLYGAGLTRIVATMHDDANTQKLEPKLLALKKEFGPKLVIKDLREGKRKTQLRARGGLVGLSQTEPWGYCNTVDAMVIRSTGDVTLCAEDARMNHVQGNVHNTPIDEIWWGYKDLRDKIQKGDSPLDICKSCAYEKL